MGQYEVIERNTVPELLTTGLGQIYSGSARRLGNVQGRNAGDVPATGSGVRRGGGEFQRAGDAVVGFGLRLDTVKVHVFVVENQVQSEIGFDVAAHGFDLAIGAPAIVAVTALLGGHRQVEGVTLPPDAPRIPDAFGETKTSIWVTPSTAAGPGHHWTAGHGRIDPDPGLGIRHDGSGPKPMKRRRMKWKRQGVGKPDLPLETGMVLSLEAGLFTPVGCEGHNPAVCLIRRRRRFLNAQPAARRCLHYAFGHFGLLHCLLRVWCCGSWGARRILTQCILYQQWGLATPLASVFRCPA